MRLRFLRQVGVALLEVCAVSVRRYYWFWHSYFFAGVRLPFYDVSNRGISGSAVANEIRHVQGMGGIPLLTHACAERLWQGCMPSSLRPRMYRPLLL